MYSTIRPLRPDFISWFTNPPTVFFWKVEKIFLFIYLFYPPTLNIVCFVENKNIFEVLSVYFWVTLFQVIVLSRLNYLKSSLPRDSPNRPLFTIAVLLIFWRWKKEKKNSENDQSTGNFQILFSFSSPDPKSEFFPVNQLIIFFLKSGLDNLCRYEPAEWDNGPASDIMILITYRAAKAQTSYTRLHSLA